MMQAVMAIEGSTTGSVSAGSLHDIHTDVIQLAQTPVNIRKRKRTSYPSPKGPTDEVKAEIERFIGYVPKVDEMFTVTNKIGEGTFSSVYLADVKCPGHDVKQQFALKHIIPTSHPERIMGELKCLHTIGGTDNVMGMNLSLRERDHVVIVMPYFEHSSFHSILRNMTVDDIQDYMRNLLLALKRVHQFDVIHRDVKPSNFLCNRKLNKYALVDFGLAQIVPTKGTKTLPKGSHPSTEMISLIPPSKTLQKLTDICHRPSDGFPRELDLNTFHLSIPTKPKDRPYSKIQRPINLKQTIPVAGRHAQLQKRRQQHPMGADVIVGHARVELPKNSLLSHGGAKTVTVHVQNSKPGVVRRGQRADSASAHQTAATRRHHPQSAESNVSRRQPVAKTCNCYGQLQVCGVCTSRSGQNAPRAGTPGFRSPEVLLKCPDQTTAVDMWAAGVILLSLLSGRYPFFRAQDDMEAFAQIMSVLGTEETKTAARKYGKEITCSLKLPAMNLKSMCIQLRRNPSPNEEPVSKRLRPNQDTPPSRNTRQSCSGTRADTTSPQSLRSKKQLSQSPPSLGNTRKGSEHIPDAAAYDLLRRLLDLNPKTRISASEAMQHPFICQ